MNEQVMQETPRQVRIVAGRLRGREVPVLEEGELYVRAALDEGGTILLPKQSQTGIRYFEEVAPC